jgi:hypothetical protein
MAESCNSNGGMHTVIWGIACRSVLSYVGPYYGWTRIPSLMKWYCHLPVLQLLCPPSNYATAQSGRTDKAGEHCPEMLLQAVLLLAVHLQKAHSALGVGLSVQYQVPHIHCRQAFYDSKQVSHSLSGSV